GTSRSGRRPLPTGYRLTGLGVLDRQRDARAAVAREHRRLSAQEQQIATPLGGAVETVAAAALDLDQLLYLSVEDLRDLDPVRLRIARGLRAEPALRAFDRDDGADRCGVSLV